jgi:outer membrane receptor protein involved in Fe transport
MSLILPKPLVRLTCKHLLYFCIASSTAASAAASTGADAGPPADSGGGGGLEEIVVTATRREENLSKVPISISAYTQETMDNKGIRDFTDIARFTPGVTIDADQTNSISIRGISSSGGAGTTGIYIDDTPIQIRALGFNPDDTLPKTFDLDRVEVLRGPQGTLFGAGSEGGTVRYIMTQPSLTKFSSYARAETSYTEGGAPSYEAGIAAGGPIIDGVLGVRASAWFRRDGGYIDRIDPTTLSILDRNANHDETTVLRFAATWAPAPGVTVTPGLLYQDRERNDISIYWPLYSDPSQNRFESANPTPRGEPDRYVLPSLKITADVGPTTFISNSSFYRRKDTSGYDGTLYNLSYYQTIGAPAAGFGLTGTPCGGTCYPLLDANGVHLPPDQQNYRSPASVTNQQDNITQEFRLQSSDPTAVVSWTLGTFFSVNRTFSLEQIHDPQVDSLFQTLYGDTIANIFGTASNADGSSYLPMGDSYLNQLIGHDRQLAGFGEAVWSITDQWKLTAGMRYSKVDYTFTSYNDGPQNGGPVYGSGEDHEQPKTYRGGLSYQHDPDNLYYFTYSTGFRIGGANSLIPYNLCQTDFNNFGISENPGSYKSDTVKSYEIGSKNNFDNRVRLAASLYYIKWNNIQQTVTLPSCELSYIDNLGSAISKGGDLQADFAVTDSFTIESAIGYNDAYYSASAYPCAGGAAACGPTVAAGDAIVGQSLTPASPWTITIGPEYKFKLYDQQYFVRLDYEHQTKNNRPTAAEDGTPGPGGGTGNTVQYLSCTTSTGTYQTCQYTPSATTFVSMRAGTNFGNFNVSAFVDNLLDTHTTTNFNYQGVDPYQSPAPTALYRNFTFRPRTIGITFTYRQ